METTVHYKLVETEDDKLNKEIHWAFPRFNMEDLQIFLIDQGYEISVYDAIREEDDYYYNSNDSRVLTGKINKIVRSFIVATLPNDELPKTFTDADITRYEVVQVFKRVMKKKLMSL